MFNLGSYFSIAIIVCNLYGLQAKSLDGDSPKSVMNTPANQLWVKMLPFFNHVAKESKCYITRDLQKIQTDNQGRLSRIESQLEILRNNIPENFEERLVRMEEQQTSLREILKKIQLDIADQQKSLGTQLEEQKFQLEALRKTIPENFEEKLTSLQENLNKMPSIIQKELKGGHKEMPESRDQIGFEKIGSRYFYIEEQINTDWPGARNICQEKGGYLAAIQNQEEFDAVLLKLKENNRYWLGINDRIVEGVYISEASGKRAPFLKWFPGDPDNRDNDEDCVGIALSKGMADWPCRFAFNFICSLDNYV